MPLGEFYRCGRIALINLRRLARERQTRLKYRNTAIHTRDVGLHPDSTPPASYGVRRGRELRLTANENSRRDNEYGIRGKTNLTALERIRLR